MDVEQFKRIASSVAIEEINSARETLKSGWGEGEKKFLDLICSYLRDKDELECCVLVEHNYGELIYDKGRLYPEVDGEFFKGNPPPLGILISDTYLEIFSDSTDRNGDPKGTGIFPTIKLIGDVQRFIGTYGLANHFLETPKSKRNMHAIFDSTEDAWSVVAGSKHVDFLINEVDSLNKLLPFFGDHRTNTSNKSFNYAFDIYKQICNKQVCDETTPQFKILFIDVNALIGSDISTEFMALLGVLSWNETSWYRRPSLIEKIPTLDLASSASTPKVNKGIEHFLNCVSSFLCGEYPAPCFIPIHDGMSDSEKEQSIAELKKYIPFPLEITHVIPKRYHDSQNTSVVDACSVWVYPVQLDTIINDNIGEKAYAQRKFVDALPGILAKIKKQIPEIDYLYFSEDKVVSASGKYTKGNVPSGVAAKINDIVGCSNFVIHQKDGVKLRLNLKALSMAKGDSEKKALSKAKGKLENNTVRATGEQVQTIIESDIVRVARKHNKNILRNFVLLTINHKTGPYV